jgi:hypothetical protein
MVHTCGVKPIGVDNIGIEGGVGGYYEGREWFKHPRPTHNNN